MQMSTPKRKNTSITEDAKSAVDASNPSLVLERKKLTSAVVTYGSHVTFDCCYEIPDNKNYFVIWNVGGKRVQRSNANFNIVCHNGYYLLRIKKVESWMTGEIICQLWEHNPEHNLLIAETSCTLSILSVSSDQMINLYTPTKHPTIHILVPSPEEQRLPTSANPLDPLFVKPSPDHLEERPETTLMELNYCRLEEDVFYYLDVTMRAPSMISAKVVIREYPRIGRRNEYPRMFILEWTEPDTQYLTWYAVDFKQNGRFIEAGFCTRPAFYIKGVEEGEKLRIRIKSARPLEAPKISLEDTVQESRICPLKDMAFFLDTYSYCYSPACISAGTFGRVNLVKNRTGYYFTSKRTNTMSVYSHVSAAREFDIMNKLHHTKVVKLIDAYWNYDCFTFVLELLWGGDLFSVITEMDNIQEIDVVPYIRQICQALQYLHTLQIAHLDLKPENIVCLSPNSKQVKLVNFGFARTITKDILPWVIYGTRNYVAPEIIYFDDITVACDMWSLGVVTYLLLSGVVPFYDNDWVKHSENITQVDYNFNEIAFRDISDLGKYFIWSLLVFRPKNRLTAAQALAHWWIKKGPPEGTNGPHLKKAMDNLKLYLANERQDCGPQPNWQRFDYRDAGNVMVAAHRLITQVSHNSNMKRSTSGTGLKF